MGRFKLLEVMARKTQRKSRRSTKKAKFRWLSLALKLALVGLVVLTFAMVYLDARVKTAFSGRKWALPAVVYARPLELFAGQRITGEGLEQELQALGYRPQHWPGPGSYRRSGGEWEIHTRGFTFVDGEEPARAIRLGSHQGSITDLWSNEGSALSLVRLEPLAIGGIYPQHNEDRELVKITEVPQYLIDGLLVAEDRDFYSHHGVSPKGIARAMFANVRAGSMVQGGSTITQQLVKNFFLTNERKLVRKIKEALMALLVEIHYGKDEILEAYLNEVYLAQDGPRAIHGVGMASRYFFNRPVDELTLAQSALLVALVRGPSYYDPWRHPERAQARRNLIIDQMQVQKLVTEKDAKVAKASKLGIGTSRHDRARAIYPAYLDLVRRQLSRDYREDDLRTQGLKIFTNFDPQVQWQAERAVANVLKGVDARVKKGVKIEAAVVVTSVDNGDVLAVVGSRDTRYAGFNRALEARRQIGSLVKPAVYLTALRQSDRYNLLTPLLDAPVAINTPSGPWRPENFDHKSHGDTPLFKALAMSYNQATARLGMDLGLGPVANTLRKLGVESDIPEVPSLLLGSIALTPFEVAAMFQTIASQGFSSPLGAIRAVTDADGEPLSRYSFEIEQRFSAESVFLLQFAMQAVIREGTGQSVYQRLPLSMNVAGKTGTSNDQRDSWFAGFTGDKLAVVWLGRDDNRATPLTGATGALAVWRDMMANISLQPLDLTPPEGIVYEWVDIVARTKAGESCANARRVPFVAGSEPQQEGECIGGTNSVKRWFEEVFR